MKHILITTIAAVVLVGCGGPKYDSALFEAARKGNIEAVKQHIAAGTDLNAKNNDGWTPLHFAGYRGCHRKITELILKEAKPADRPARWPPLQSAFWKSHNEIIELLISNGADVNAKANDGATPLDTVSFLKHPEIADLLRKHGGKTGEELKAEGK
jgi:ankyrin repeat protein